MDNPYEPPTTPPTNVEWDYDKRPEDRRPAVVTVFGILNLVFSTFALVCAPVNIVFLTIDLPGLNANPALRVLQDPTYRVGMIALYVFGIVGAVVELAAGIGLIKMRPWGRSLSLVFVSLAILYVLAQSVFSWVYVIPAMKGIGQNGDPQAQGAALGGMIGGTIGPLIGLVYPILLLIFMFTPKVVQAFDRKRSEGDELAPLTPL